MWHHQPDITHRSACRDRTSNQQTRHQKHHHSHAPNFNAEVVREAVRLGMVCLPGVLTPTEAFAALAAGASGLKLFPAEMIGPAVVKALRAVLPAEALLLPVGGVTPDNVLIGRDTRASALRRPHS